MRLKDATMRLARRLLPSVLLVRHSTDDAERRANRQATIRANLAVDRWQQAMKMQRALHFEADFWERHREHGGG